MEVSLEDTLMAGRWDQENQFRDCSRQFNSHNSSQPSTMPLYSGALLSPIKGAIYFSTLWNPGWLSALLLRTECGRNNSVWVLEPRHYPHGMLPWNDHGWSRSSLLEDGRPCGGKLRCPSQESAPTSGAWVGPSWIFQLSHQLNEPPWGSPGETTRRTILPTHRIIKKTISCGCLF